MEYINMCVIFLVALVSLFLGFFVSFFIRSISINHKQKKRYHKLADKNKGNEKKEKQKPMEKPVVEYEDEDDDDDKIEEIEEQQEQKEALEQEEDNEEIKPTDDNDVEVEPSQNENFDDKSSEDDSKKENLFGSIKNKFKKGFKDKDDCPLNRVEQDYEGFIEFSHEDDDVEARKTIRRLQKTQDSKYIEKIKSSKPGNKE